MGIRILMGVLLAVAMSFAPLGMAGGEAMANPAGHHAEMDAGAAHCPDQTQPAQHDKTDGKPCCAAGCTAAATLPARTAAPPAPPTPRPRASTEEFYHGILSEIATPPPRPS